jgi:3-oxoacyl-[acyl-carrier protein] reductase
MVDNGQCKTSSSAAAAAASDSRWCARWPRPDIAPLRSHAATTTSWPPRAERPPRSTAFGPLYGLINNAGLGTSGILSNMRDQDIQRLIQLNTVSPILMSKYAVRSMMAQRDGRIINIASVVAFTGYSGLAVYSATKASLIGFTRSLAREVGQLGITVNALAPGFIATEMTHELNEAQRLQIAKRSALKRMADPADVARSVEFLLGEGGRNITGTTLTIDAGNTA